MCLWLIKMKPTGPAPFVMKYHNENEKITMPVSIEGEIGKNSRVVGFGS